MKTISKYGLAIADEQIVMMPSLSHPKHVAMQNGEPYLWAEVLDHLLIYEHRRIFIIATGAQIPPKAVEYIGTCHGDLCSWHVYDGGLVV